MPCVAYLYEYERIFPLLLTNNHGRSNPVSPFITKQVFIRFLVELENIKHKQNNSKYIYIYIYTLWTKKCFLWICCENGLFSRRNLRFFLIKFWVTIGNKMKNIFLIIILENYLLRIIFENIPINILLIL